MSMQLTVEQRLHNFYNGDRKLVRRIIKRVKAKQRK